VDKIFLQGLKISAIIGVLPWERTAPQTLLIDLEIATDIDQAAQQDHLTAAIDYAMVAQRVTEFVADSQYNLLETLAANIMTLLHDEFHVSWIRLRISKPDAIANCNSVGVMVEKVFK
jgi:dihydroneopterin aldolase